MQASSAFAPADGSDMFQRMVDGPDPQRGQRQLAGERASRSSARDSAAREPCPRRIAARQRRRAMAPVAGRPPNNGEAIAALREQLALVRQATDLVRESSDKRGKQRFNSQRRGCVIAAAPDRRYSGQRRAQVRHGRTMQKHTKVSIRFATRASARAPRRSVASTTTAREISGRSSGPGGSDNRREASDSDDQSRCRTRPAPDLGRRSQPAALPRWSKPPNCWLVDFGTFIADRHGDADGGPDHRLEIDWIAAPARGGRRDEVAPAIGVRQLVARPMPDDDARNDDDQRASRPADLHPAATDATRSPPMTA